MIIALNNLLFIVYFILTPYLNFISVIAKPEMLLTFADEEVIS